MEKKSVLIITGSYPPDVCGMGDSTALMRDSLFNHGGDIYYSKDWRLSTLVTKIKQINQIHPKAVNMQYPTLHYGWSLVPHLLCIWFSLFSEIRFGVTLHEFSQGSFKYKICSYIFLLFANRIIFTNEFERREASRYLYFVRKKSRVIKTYSNIDAGDIIGSIKERHIDVAYFGHIKPLKGIEKFLDICEELKERRPDLNIILIGQVFSDFYSFYEDIVRRAENIGITICRDKDSKTVGNILSDTKITYLPYPDGVSERRGTLFAAVRNECLVVTNNGRFVTPQLREICLFPSLGSECKYIISLLDKSENFYVDYQLSLKNYMQNYLPDSWDKVEENIRSYLLD